MKTKKTTKASLPALLAPESLTVLVDTREQIPLDLHPLKTVTSTLTTGDYSVLGLQHIVAIERKSLPDLLGCVGGDRERFEREVQRLLAYPVRALVVESTWNEIEGGDWRSKVKPNSVIGSVLGWISMGLPVVMAGDHEQAGRYVSRILFIAARRRWCEARSLVGVVTGKPIDFSQGGGA